MKKIFALAITATILLSGCTKPEVSDNQAAGPVNLENIGDTGGLQLPIDKKNTEIEILLGTNSSNLSNSLIIKELSRRTGLNIKITEVAPATAIEKVKVIMASKELPDIMATGFNNNDEITQFGVQGAFVAINKYVDQLPNLKKIFYDSSENADVISSGLSYDGNFYSFPNYDINRAVNHGVLYRKDIFDKHGIKMWNSPEEFYQALKKLKELYPDSTPFVSKTKEVIFSQLSTSWGLAAPGPYYDEESKTWKYSATDPKYKEMLDYMRKLYVDGLIDPEFLTSTEAAWTSRMVQAGKAFITYDWIGKLDAFTTQGVANDPNYDLRYGNPIGPKGTAVTLPKATLSGPCVTNNDKKELSLKLLDYLLSPSGAELITLGLEGQTYKKNEDGSVSYLGYEDGKTVTIQNLEEKYGLFTSGIYRRLDKKCIYFNFTEREQEAQDVIINSKRFEPADPKLSFLQDEKSKISTILTQLNKEANIFSVSYVLGNDVSEAAWENWCSKANKFKVQEVLDVYNTAQHRYDSQMKK